MVPERYFFSEGIRFTCVDCGHCCTGAPGVVRISDTEIATLADWLQQPAGTVRETYILPDAAGIRLREKPNGDCCFFDGRCRIYPVRPRQCRTYPFWFRNLRSPEAWAETCRACPGIGQGRWYSPAEIIERVQEDLS